MKRSLQIIGAVLLVAAAVVRADGPEDQYVGICTLILEADSLNDAGQPREAMAKYAEAQAALAKFPTSYPGWNDKLVSFRLNYIASKLAPLVSQHGTNVLAAPVMVATNAAAKPRTTETNALVRELKEEVQRLRADNLNLSAKLKEALSVQPALADPRELAKADQKNKALQKENELLKVSLAQEQSKSSRLVDAALLADANRALAELRVKQSGRESELQRQLAIAQATVKTNELLLASLRQEKALWETHSAKAPAPETNTAKPDSKKAKLLQQALDKQIAATKESEKSVAKLQREKADLEARLNGAALAAARDEAKRRKQLEDEISSLRAKLAKAEKRNGQRAGSRDTEAETQKQLLALEARLRVLEAKPIPYTADELAALAKPEVQLALAASASTATAPPPKETSVETNSAPARKTFKELPPGAGALAAAAQRAFAAKRFDEAEAKYIEILRQDEKNVFTLGNAAAIQIELNKLSEAEKNLTTALSIDPQDDFCLYLMGRVRFLQGKLDEAFNLLSQAAKANPDNAETQNYLGIVLSEKGLRAQAETAFRKAVQLQPGYASAHNNLAFIYATQKPPSLALARWHYRKAISAGHPKNPDLEKLLGESK